MSETAFPPGADVAGIGAQMQLLRVRQGLTQTELAGERFTRAYVSSIEGGKRTPSAAATAHFAARLGADFEDLCFGYEPGRRRALQKQLTAARTTLSRGEPDEAAAAYAAVAAEAQRHHDPLLRAAGRCGLGLVARHRGDAAAAGELFAEADALLAGQPLSVRLPAVMGRMWSLFAGGSVVDALAYAWEQLRRAGAGVEPAAEFALQAATGFAHVERGNLARAGAAADVALQLAPEVTDPQVLAQGYYHLNRVLTAQGRYEEGEQAIVRATALYEHLGLPTEVGMCRFAQGYLSASRGRLAEAEAHLRQARTVLARTGATTRLVNATAELAEVLRRLERTDEAAALVEECRALSLGYHDPEQAAELDRIGAQIAFDRGDDSAGEALLRSAADRYEAVGAAMETAATCRLLGDRLVGWGRTAEAAAVYRRGLVATERPRPDHPA
ncbi:hypothetical protein [Streptomyces sp. NPDC012888]|uniref:hypothetical protein n=1 Tax=Streptomyces sp. NPDC012888 TaxID=3364855 RepID=UPI00367E2E35